MSGRGRGRGRGQLTFNVDALGIRSGESLPPSAVKPSPVFPPMQVQPLPLQASEEVEYMLALKQELRASTKVLPFYIMPAKPKKDVVRYSDKYQSSEPQNNTIEWSPDWSRMPAELRVKVRKPLESRERPALKRKVKSEGKQEVLQKLEKLEKKEQEAASGEEEEDGEGKKKNEEEEEQEDDNDYDGEEFEEETDYIMSYFDNGEDFGGDSDDNMDEATY
ncbi:DNA-directed RNA polymerase III subunit RPC7-like [Denticeps clupeoides]|uniref:DNA-directed RNA polymerase III subunit n=1 Tax=Denticeps clupeoides TaxID=299321 RepID=A0AAY4ELD9_9TELE|nr:DNA-directed RNA polymerase III subunit RPC7-like [Denticeps clupeoides]XP_028819961.1 DNA-directed RNA polymerase III subunit RPC7-like [Denticeps clupeoides]